MSEQFKGMVEYAHNHFHVMVEQLKAWCQINSGSENLKGLSTMRDVLLQAYEPLADHITTIAMPEIPQINMRGEISSLQSGDALLIRKRPELKRRILLAGHMDTVFGIEHPFQNFRTIDENTINGPGVADMKGGLLVILHALTAFESTLEAKDIGWDVFINADEEIGSLASSTYLNEFSKTYPVGLIYEPAMTPDGCLAKNRKGSGKLTLVAKGKSAHAGRAFDEGRNAIYVLAKAIGLIHQLNGQREGVTINIGKIQGGEALNVVPEQAVAKLDIRIANPRDEHWVRESIHHIISSVSENGLSIEVKGDFSRPVKKVTPATIKLFERIKAIGESHQIHIDWKDSGGCCDGNNLAQHGMPVIDTLGVRGGNIHRSDEYILLDSLTERTILSSLILHDLAKGGLEQLRND